MTVKPKKKPEPVTPAPDPPKRGRGRPAYPEGQKLTLTERSHRRRAKLAVQIAESFSATLAAIAVLADIIKGDEKGEAAIKTVRENYEWAVIVGARAHGLKSKLDLPTT
jgi:hypothetical protein